MQKNILHIIYQTHIIGGVERFLELLSQNSGENNSFVQVYSDENKTNIKGPIFSLNETVKSYNPFVLLYLTFKRAKQYGKISKNEQADITISHGDSLNLSNIASKLYFGNTSKIYIFLHNSLNFYTNRTSFLYPLLFNYFYPKADKLITISKEMAFDMKMKGYKNISTLYNPVNIKTIRQIKKEHLGEYETLFQNEKKTFITIGRLEKVKNIQFIITSFNDFSSRNKNYQLVIIGEGEERQVIERYLKIIGNENIHLLGKQENVYKFLNKSDFFLFSSLNEGFGRVLIEALSCGLPVLTHDFKYGAKEIIRNNEDFSECKELEVHDNGILTPYMDKENFIKGIEKLVDREFDKNKIEKNLEKYSIEKFQSELINIL